MNIAVLCPVRKEAMRSALGLLFAVGCGTMEAAPPPGGQPDTWVDAGSDTAIDADADADAASDVPDTEPPEAGDVLDERLDCDACDWSAWCDTTTGQCTEYASSESCSFPPQDDTHVVCVTIESEPDVWRTSYCSEEPPEPAGCIWLEAVTCWACRLRDKAFGDQ